MSFLERLQVTNLLPGLVLLQLGFLLSDVLQMTKISSKQYCEQRSYDLAPQQHTA